VSLVVTSTDDWEGKEVIAVTPCDGIIEAVRFADEQRLELFCIDEEVAPRHLWMRHCFRDSEWPDDALVLASGVRDYLNLVQERLSDRPARLEPVDSWRESHMAARLRRLAPRYHRVLCICDIARVLPLSKLLASEETLTEFESPVPPLRLKIQKPNLSTLLSYLDDIPYLVEVYERDRAMGRAADFSKHAALLEGVRRIQGKSGDVCFSTRHYQKFGQFLINLLEYTGHLSPELEHAMTAAGCCFNTAFAKQVRGALLSYAGQVNVARVGERIKTLEVEDGREIFVARSCNPSRASYSVAAGTSSTREEGSYSTGLATEGELAPATPSATQSVEGPATSPATERLEIDTPQTKKPETSAYVWPEWARLVVLMRDRAIQVARQRVRRLRSVKYAGSLDRGLDLRRTLRSHIGADPSLYVRARPFPERIDPYEPIVWLFEPTSVTEGQFNTMYIQECATIGWYWGTQKAPVYNDPAKGEIVLSYHLYGIVDFTGIRRSITNYRLALRNRRQPPTGYALTKEGRILNDLVKEVRPGWPWWEVLLFAAVKYSKENTLCICNPFFQIPARVRRHAAYKGKSIIQLPLSFFDADTLQKIRRPYFAAAKEDPLGKNLIQQFGEIIARFWRSDSF
jgi:hypothetical protein